MRVFAVCGDGSTRTTTGSIDKRFALGPALNALLNVLTHSRRTSVRRLVRSRCSATIFSASMPMNERRCSSGSGSAMASIHSSPRCARRIWRLSAVCCASGVSTASNHFANDKENLHARLVADTVAYAIRAGLVDGARAPWARCIELPPPSALALVTEPSLTRS